MTEFIGGFGKVPMRRSVFVNRQYGCLWYFWNGSEAEPIEDNNFYGFVEQLRIVTTEYKGKEVAKLHIDVKTGGPQDPMFRLVAGLDTAFAKSIVSALLGIQDFSQMVAIAVKAGDDESVIFASAWIPGSERVETPQLKTTEDLMSAIGTINSRITGEPLLVAPAANTANRDRIANLIAITGHVAEQARGIRHGLFGDKLAIADYSEAQMEQLRDALFVDWAARFECWNAPQHRDNAYVKLVKGMGSVSDLELFDAWKSDCESRQALSSEAA